MGIAARLKHSGAPPAIAALIEKGRCHKSLSDGINHRRGPVSRIPFRLATACVTALALGAVSPCRLAAQVTTERGASILVFPKVVADSSHDTVIQLANLSDNSVDAYCAYLGGSPTALQSLAFHVAVGPQGPVHWAVATGHAPTGNETLDVPAAPASFRGELLCVQVDASGAPFNGDQLAGQATLVDLASGDVAAYTAVGLQGAGFNDGDEFLCIGGEPSDDCLIGAEYNACPAEWILAAPADGAVDPQLGAGSQLSTRLAVAPCSQNLRDGEPGTVTIHFSVVNELAVHFTGTVSVTGWADLSLADLASHVFTREKLGSDYGEMRLTPAAGSGGFMLVAQTTRSSGGGAPLSSSAGVNLSHRGGADASDVVVLSMPGAP